MKTIFLSAFFLIGVAALPGFAEGEDENEAVASGQQFDGTDVSQSAPSVDANAAAQDPVKDLISAAQGSQSRSGKSKAKGVPSPKSSSNRESTGTQLLKAVGAGLGGVAALMSAASTVSVTVPLGLLFTVAIGAALIGGGVAAMWAAEDKGIKGSAKQVAVGTGALYGAFSPAFIGQKLGLLAGRGLEKLFKKPEGK